MIDTHNDLPEMLRERAGNDLEKMNPDLPLDSIDTDIPRLKQGLVGGQFWAAYVPSTFIGKGAARYALEEIDVIRRMTARSPTLRFATTADDIVRIHAQGKIASLIGIEGGHAIENSMGTLRQFYELGVRYMTLTWNNGQAWADANSDTVRAHGLSPFGREVVREMNRLGMLVDLAHVSDSTMAQALRVSEAPVILSHSSARALVDVPRNVPDALLRQVRDNGGIVMVNFYCGFVDTARARYDGRMDSLVRDLRVRFAADTARGRAAYTAWVAANPPPPPPPLTVVADHIDHVRQVAGVDHVGYGSDFDGIDCAPQGLSDVSMFPRLTAELLRRGWSDGDAKKVVGLNLLRVMRQAEQVAARLQRERGPSAATLGRSDSTATRH